MPSLPGNENSDGNEKKDDLHFAKPGISLFELLQCLSNFILIFSALLNVRN
jgi:hypothetical protein